jgi:hypothetical protein
MQTGGAMQHLTPDRDGPTELTIADARRVLEAHGPTWQEVLAAMVGYGLSDVEISRYFRLPCDVIRILRQHWDIRENF